MNYDVKINHVYQDFQNANDLKHQNNASKNVTKSQSNVKITSSTDFYNKNGDVLETVEQTIDDILVRTPLAHLKINKKLTNPKFMKKL